MLCLQSMLRAPPRQSSLVKSSIYKYASQCMTTSDEEYHRMILSEPESPPNSKILKVAVLGMPNAGKSTLLNMFLSKNLLPTSSKIDTTIRNTSAVLTVDETQVVFYDTPGIHNRRKGKKLGISGNRIQSPEKCFGESDIGLVLADLTSKQIKEGFLPPEILLTLTRNRHVPAILLLTKEDAYKKKSNLLQLIYLFTAGKLDDKPYGPEKHKLALMRVPKIVPIDFEDFSYDIIEDENASLMRLRRCRGWPFFKEVFTISANSQKNINLLLTYLLSQAKHGKWEFNQNVQVDQSPQDCVIDMFRAEMLNCLPHEIPYNINIVISNWGVQQGILHIELNIFTKTLRHKKIFIAHLKNILNGTRQKLHDLFFCEVFIKTNIVE